MSNPLSVGKAMVNIQDYSYKDLPLGDFAQLVQAFQTRSCILPIPMFICDANAGCININPPCEKLLNCTQADTINWGWLEFVHPEDSKTVLEHLKETIKTGEKFDLNVRLKSKQHKIIHVRATINAVIENNVVTGLIGTLSDQTENQELQRELQQHIQLLSAMTNAMSEGIVVHNKDGKIVVCNPAAEKILSLSKQQLLGKMSADPDWNATRQDGTPFAVHEHPSMIALKEGRQISDVIMGIKLPDRPQKWISINSSPILNPDTRIPEAVVSTFVDITDRLNFESQIEYQVLQLSEARIELEMKQRELEQLNSRLQFQAETDALTLLFNRGAICNRLDRICRERTILDYGILLLDIDFFKNINDTYGHEAGDTVLKLMSSVLSELTPTGGAVGRFGGEEFLFILTECSLESLGTFAESVRGAIESFSGGPINLTVSIGYAHAIQSRDSNTLLKFADVALYHSKNHGRNQSTSYS